MLTTKGDQCSLGPRSLALEREKARERERERERESMCRALYSICIVMVEVAQKTKKKDGVKTVFEKIVLLTSICFDLIDVDLGIEFS